MCKISKHRAMFTKFSARIFSKKQLLHSFVGDLLPCSARIMSSSVTTPWSFVYINGPDNPLYLKRVNSTQIETESTISVKDSEVLKSGYTQYLLLTNDADSSYVSSAIHAHLAYRQNGTWPSTLFSHAVFIRELENTQCLKRGVFCCCTSKEHQTQVLDSIQDFLKKNSNFLVYEFLETSAKYIYKLAQIGNHAGSTNSDNREIQIQLVNKASVKALQESASVASPIFSDSDISPVFHSYKEALGILKKISDVPEVKELIDISVKYATTFTEKSCDHTGLHPFVVVEGLDATGKTTLTEHLEKRMGAARYFTPPPKITDLRAFFDKYPEIVRRAYYSMGNYIVAGEIIKECQSRPVIMDRFWHSTAAYGIANETSSGDLPESDHWVYRWPGDLLKPTLVLFLTVSEDVRQQRLIGRNETFEEKSLDKDQLFRQRLCDAYRRMKKPSCIEIDAGGSVEEVQGKALEVLKSHGQVRIWVIWGQKYLLLTNDADSSYVSSAIHAHLAYRQNGTWPSTLFSHAVFIRELENTQCLKRGVFCCCTSKEHQTQVLDSIQDFLKKNSNFLVYEFLETSAKYIYKLAQIGNHAGSTNSDNREIQIQLVNKASVKALQESASVASPIFSDSDISPVFHSYKEALGILKKISDVPEVKELIDISVKYATTFTEKSCDHTGLHPFVVVEGLDATGKTTLTEHLEKRMGAARYFTPPPKITDLRAFFDKYPEIVRRAYYSMGNYIVAGEIIKECQSRPVIMDRFWHSTAAYGIANETSSGDLPESDHWVYRWPGDLLKPTLVLFLTVSEDVRQQRLIGRNETFEEKSLDKDQLFRQRLCDAYRRMKKPSCIEIDAGGSVEEVQGKALEVLKSHGVNLDSMN